MGYPCSDCGKYCDPDCKLEEEEEVTENYAEKNTRPLTQELANELKRIIDEEELSGAADSWSEGWKTSKWPVYQKCPVEQRSKLVLGLRLMASCFVPQLGVYWLSFIGVPEAVGWFCFDEKSEDQRKFVEQADGPIGQRLVRVEFLEELLEKIKNPEDSGPSAAAVKQDQLCAQLKAMILGE